MWTSVLHHKHRVLLFYAGRGRINEYQLPGKGIINCDDGEHGYCSSQADSRPKLVPLICGCLVLFWTAVQTILLFYSVANYAYRTVLLRSSCLSVCLLSHCMLHQNKRLLYRWTARRFFAKWDSLWNSKGLTRRKAVKGEWGRKKLVTFGLVYLQQDAKRTS